MEARKLSATEGIVRGVRGNEAGERSLVLRWKAVTSRLSLI